MDVIANGSTYTQILSYDVFGNILTNQTTTEGLRSTPTQPWSNHLTGATYNQAGSVLTWNGWSHEWDPMQMMKRRLTGVTQRLSGFLLKHGVERGLAKRCRARRSWLLRL